MKKLSILFLILSFNLGFTQSETTTFYLIRHAEKKDTSKDPELSEEGKLRAKNWANYFDEIPIDYFYSTATIRATTTCSIIAASKKKDIQLYNHKEFTINELLSKHQGKTILIVGHSNTIPVLINTFLGEEMYPMIAENEYSSLYILTIQGDSIKHQLKYITN